MRALRMFGSTAAAVALLALTACSPTAGPGPGATSASPPEPSATETTPDPVESLSLEQKVAQLFMVGTPVDEADPTTLAAVTDDGVGGIFLHGRSTRGADSAADLVDRFTDASDSDLPLWVATDQEGGDVQVLGGDGFDTIPSAVEQGKTDAADLRSSAETWGEQLSDAGVTVNLAPVADIVPPDSAGDNPPIGALDREYGGDADSVADGAGAFAAGMRDAGVLPTLKHFPGLGHVTENTDFSTHVTDSTVSSDSADLDVYRTLLDEGPAVVMMSTAIYDEIDPDLPAAFSPTVVSLLRDDLGFDGVVTTDDLSSAEQVSSWSPGERATKAVDAGVDLLLVSSDPSVYPDMRDAVLHKAEDDPEFAERVDEAARHVAAAKAG